MFINREKEIDRFRPANDAGNSHDSQSPLYGRSDEILRIRPMEMAVLSDYLGTNPMEA